MVHRIIIGIILFGIAISCNDPEEQPAVIQINDVRIMTTDEQGAATENITDLYLNTPDEELGAFPIPATVPIFSEGRTELIAAPGIRVNGTRALPERYFPLEFEIIPLDLNRGLDNEPFDIVFKYRDAAQFAFVEDFEQGVEFFIQDIDGNMNSRMAFTDVNVRSGSGAGILQVDEDNPVNAVSHSFTTAMSLEASRSIFLEMDYLLRSSLDDVLFTVSVSTFDRGGVEDRTVVLSLRPRDDWNKIYFDLGSILIPERDIIVGYSINLELISVQEEDFIGSGEILFDNIKLVYE